MRIFILTFQFFERNMRVDFRCGDTFMSQQLLDGGQVRLVVQHSRSERVAKHVRTPLLDGGHLRKVFLHNLRNLFLIHCRSLFSHEQCWKSSLPQCLFTSYLIGFDFAFQFFAKRDDALFVALSRRLDLLGHQIHTCICHAEQLSASDPCFIEHHENKPVPDALEAPVLRGQFEQSVHFRFPYIIG